MSITEVVEVECEGRGAPHQVVVADSIDKPLPSIDRLGREFYGDSPITELVGAGDAADDAADEGDERPLMFWW